MSNFLIRIFQAKIAYPTFAWVLSSLAFATYILFHRDLIASTPFAQHLPVDILIWSICLMVGDITVLTGMILRLRNVPLVRIGAFISFLCWTFGNIAAFQQDGGWFTVILLTGWYWLMYIYLYLAASVGLFRRGADDPGYHTDE